jgi:hypothetical protein
MKKTLACLLASLLALALITPVLAAETPAVGSLKAVKQTIRGNSSWTPDSYPEVWITPVFAEYIIQGKETYPADFLRFAPPANGAPVDIRADFVTFIDFDTLLTYSYQAMDRYSFEVFLEKADPANTVSDGSDGVAAYGDADRRRGLALLNLKEQFGGTAKLYIELYDNTGDLSSAELAQQAQAEAERVRAGMALEHLDRFWSQGVFSSVELYDNRDKNLSVIVDTSDWTIVKMNSDTVKQQVVGGLGVIDTSVAIETYVRDEAVDAQLADGTPYKVYNSEYTGQASFPINEKKYLQITIGVGPELFPAELGKVYPLVTVNAGEE